MPILHAIILGLVQGLSEFLPISSSGHLVLVPWLFGWNDFGTPAIEKAFDWKVNTREEISKTLKNLKESSKRSANYFEFARSLMLRCLHHLESLTQPYYLNLIAMHQNVLKIVGE